MDPILVTLLSVFGGAALTALAGLVGALFQSRREHKRWVRQQRFDAYQRTLRLVQRMFYGQVDLDFVKGLRKELSDAFDGGGIPPVEREKLVDERLSAFGELHTPPGHFRWTREIVGLQVESESVLALVGPLAVSERLEAVFSALTDKDEVAYRGAFAVLQAQMRVALATN